MKVVGVDLVARLESLEKGLMALDSQRMRGVDLVGIDSEDRVCDILDCSVCFLQAGEHTRSLDILPDLFYAVPEPSTPV